MGFLKTDLEAFLKTDLEALNIRNQYSKSQVNIEGPSMDVFQCFYVLCFSVVFQCSREFIDTVYTVCTLQVTPSVTWVVVIHPVDSSEKAGYETSGKTLT